MLVDFDLLVSGHILKYKYLLKVLAGLTFHQAGEMTETSPKATATRYRRAFTTLENQLQTTSMSPFAVQSSDCSSPVESLLVQITLRSSSDLISRTLRLLFSVEATCPESHEETK